MAKQYQQNGHSEATLFDSVRLNDFVAHPQIDVDGDALGDYLQNRTVLITGAGGSVGSELAAQLLHHTPQKILLADISEHNLYQLRRTLSAPPATELIYSLSDVRDANDMHRLFERTTPDIVVHAAAYKHVPLIEEQPVAGFENNTLATANLLDVCEAHAIEQFVLISTDKAVEPVSVLGATKRLAEWLVRSADASLNRKIIRFGNVFGSRGSVVPLFLEHLTQGRPLPITHPDMERYFMSAENASRLILQTLLLNGAPIFALRMGDPLRIEWLARQMIRRFRPDADPDRLIEYTERRPGEKLSEQLIAPDESWRPTTHPCIMGLHSDLPVSSEALRHCIENLAGRPNTSVADFRSALLHVKDATRNAFRADVRGE
jgi:FlaA1/EpsC-like NDP-sugar epimerase